MKKLIVAVFSLMAPILLERIFSGFLEKGIQYMVSNECFFIQIGFIEGFQKESALI